MIIENSQLTIQHYLKIQKYNKCDGFGLIYIGRKSVSIYIILYI